jgi:hypothetical protein
MLPDVSDAAVRNIFDRINRNSRKLTPQEIRHAKYDGWFITTVEAEADKQEWKDFGLSTTSRAKRMADVQFVSELFQILINQRIEGFDQDALDDLYAQYEDTADQSTFIEEDLLAEIERVKAYIHEALKIKPVLREYTKVQSHFYSLWAYLALEKARLLPVQNFAPKYAAFLDHVNKAIKGELPQDPDASVGAFLQNIIDYATSARGASTDLNPRSKRHAALIADLHGTHGAIHEDH